MPKTALYEDRLIGASISVPACMTGDTKEAEGPSGVDRAYRLFVDEGLSCECMREISVLNSEEMSVFRERLQASFELDEHVDIVEHREQGCATPRSEDGLGKAVSAITGTYVVERLEEASYNGSWGGSTVYRDGAAYGNMCGSDGDYIVEFDSISNAYSNHSNLRIEGLTSRGTCLLGWAFRHYSDARIYSDNDIRACIGYWAGVWCGAPVSGDLWPHF